MKWVDTVAVCVTLATFGLVPLQLGRFDVAVSHETATLVLVIVTFKGGFAVFHAVTAAVHGGLGRVGLRERVGPGERRRLGGGGEIPLGDEDLPYIECQAGCAHQARGHEPEHHDGGPSPITQKAAKSHGWRKRSSAS